MLPNSNGVQPTYFNPDSRQNVSVHVYLNFVSSDNDIKQNNRNNGIADDTGNRRELVHLHGTYT